MDLHIINTFPYTRDINITNEQNTSKSERTTLCRNMLHPGITVVLTCPSHCRLHLHYVVYRIGYGIRIHDMVLRSYCAHHRDVTAAITSVTHLRSRLCLYRVLGYKQHTTYVTTTMGVFHSIGYDA